MAVADHARPDLVAHAHATRASFEDVATELRELLGAKLVAYLGGVGETRAVNQWAEGERAPSDEVQQRLRFALRVALPIANADSPKIAQAWFQGLNPQLDDRSPARLLREGELDEVGPAIVAAERAFLIGGWRPPRRGGGRPGRPTGAGAPPPPGGPAPGPPPAPPT